MTSLQPLIVSVAVLGVVIYGVTRSVKPLIPKKWRRETALGKFSILFLPLLLGCMFAWVGLNSLAGYISNLLGYETVAFVPWGARLLMGLFSGTLATQIHNIVKHKIKYLSPEEGESDE